MLPSRTPGNQFGMCECEVPLKQANILCSCLGPELIRKGPGEEHIKIHGVQAVGVWSCLRRSPRQPTMEP